MTYRLIRKSLHSGRGDSDPDPDPDRSSEEGDEDGENSEKSDISLNRIRGRDCFHDGSAVSQAVTDWHAHLKHSLRASDPITADILKMIDDHMLRGPENERLDACELEALMRKLLDDAKTNAKRDLSYMARKYFRNPIKQEQYSMAKAIRDHVTRQGPKSLLFKYKSIPFIQASKEPLRGGLAGEDVDNVLAGLPPPPRPSTAGQDPDQAPGRSSTIPVRGSRDWPPNTSDTSLQKVRSPSDASSMKYVDYLGARELLEERGWISGTIVIPEDAAGGHDQQQPLTATQGPSHQPAPATILTDRLGAPSTPTAPPLKRSRTKLVSGGLASIVKERLSRVGHKRRSLGPLSPPSATAAEDVVSTRPAAAPLAPDTQKSLRRKDTQRSISEMHKSQYTNDAYLKDRDFVSPTHYGPGNAGPARGSPRINRYSSSTTHQACANIGFLPANCLPS